eukprot:scaffold24810_cov112-Isochrysis_galbana.AAC.1
MEKTADATPMCGGNSDRTPYAIVRRYGVTDSRAVRVGVHVFCQINHFFQINRVFGANVGSGCP